MLVEHLVHRPGVSTGQDRGRDVALALSRLDETRATSAARLLPNRSPWSSIAPRLEPPPDAKTATRVRAFMLPGDGGVRSLRDEKIAVDRFTE
jgi:hypothetical protein